MSQVLIAAPFLISLGFVLGTIWKGIFKREDDASARIDSPRTIEDAARRAGAV